MEKLVAAVTVFALLIGFALLLAWPTVWMVNYLFTAQLLTFVLGVAKITFWKAFCLDVLFGSWFKSSTSSKSNA